MKILIINVHSALNLGDDAIMHVTLEGLKNKFPDCEITIAANDPDSWQKYQDAVVVNSLCNWAADCRLGYFKKGLLLSPVYLVVLLIFSALYRILGIQTMLRASEKRQLLSAYYQADLILSCGGGNYFAHKRLSPGFLWTLFTAYFAILLGKRLIMLPQSFGPIEGNVQRILTRYLLNSIDVIMLREKVSHNYLETSFGIDRQKLKIINDLAFYLDAPSTNLAMPEDLTKEELCIGITLIDHLAQNPSFTNQTHYEEAVESAIYDLVYSKQAKIYLFVQCYGPSVSHNDRLITERIYHHLSVKIDDIVLLDSFNSGQEIRESFGQMDLVIGTRMHTGIFALSKGIPLILIGYQPKAKGIMSAFELRSYYIPIDEINKANLGQKVEMLLKDRENVMNQIVERYNEMRLSNQDWLAYIEA